MNILKLWVRKFEKMESGTFVNFGYGNFRINESASFVNFLNFGYENFKKWIRNYCEFLVWEFLKKWNPELCEFLETLGMEILKMESETLGTKILKIESGTSWIFGNFGYENFKNEFGTFVNFWKLWAHKF